jgi:hypothetical protein
MKRAPKSVLALALAIALAACSANKPAATPQPLHQRLVGTWEVELEDREARLARIARLALADGNKDKELEAMKPTPEEIEVYDGIVSMVMAADPRVERIEKQVKDSEMLVTITPDAVRFGPAKATYVVEKSSGREVTLRANLEGKGEPEKVDVSFVDEDTITVKRESEPKPHKLVRKK